MKIMFVTSEMTPFAATGGLGEVSEGLPVALAEMGHEVTVVLPLYRQVDRAPLQWFDSFSVRLGWRCQECGCYAIHHRGIRVVFLENAYYFSRPYLYGEYDDGERFAFFCAAAVTMIRRMETLPDILHLNDWQTALCLPYLKLAQREDVRLSRIGTVYTIHNMEYQGIYSSGILGDVFGLSREEGNALQANGSINLTAGAIRLCDRLTTVSPSYAKQLEDDRFALGLGGVVSANRHKLFGIINGIDERLYAPENGAEGTVPFSADAMGGKTQNKESLQREMGLPITGERMLVAMVTRLASHKGIDLVMENFAEMMACGVQFVLLGCGEGRYEAFFRYVGEKYPEQARAVIGFDRPLSRRIYAGADLFLMPSRSEACGVAQMIAARYGAVPLVHRIGGLCDTVAPYDSLHNTGDGFAFSPFTGEAMMTAFCTAAGLYAEQRERFDEIRLRAMQRDRSWYRSAREYETRYHEVCQFES